VSVLASFIYLQVLDYLTTIAFLIHGVSEANPIVTWVMRESPSPLGGLLLVKVVAVLLALVCMAHAKQLLLRRVNVFFAALVAHNVVVLIIHTPVLR
jgi:hypothetical protein